MEIVMNPIGYIKSPFKEKKEIPKQSILAEDKKGIIKILPKYEEGIKDIEIGSYGILLFYFHESKEVPIKVVSHKTNKVTGVFSTRSPDRPNGIGMSTVKFTKVEKSSLEFEGVDMLDGTPVLDIKPYSSKLDPK